MKTIVLFLILVAAPASAAVSYTIEKSTFSMEPDLGTFVVNGSTYGFITGIIYSVKGTDGVESCVRSGIVFATPPKTSFPSTNTVKNLIQQDVTDQGFKTDIQKCIAKKEIAANALTSSKVPDNVSGVDGSTITPP